MRIAKRYGKPLEPRTLRNIQTRTRDLVAEGIEPHEAADMAACLEFRIFGLDPGTKH